MRVRSTDAVSRRDDQAREVLEASSRVLDWSAPGTIDNFGQAAVYAPDGLDLATGLSQSTWFSVSAWPAFPVAILCETTVRLCGADRQQTQGLAVAHLFSCADVAPSGSWDPRRNRTQVTPGGIFVLREDALWFFDFAADEVYRWANPHAAFVPAVRTPSIYAPSPLESGTLLPAYPAEEVTNFAYGVWSTGEALFVGTSSALEVLVRAPAATTFTRPWSADPLTPIKWGAAGSFRDVAVTPDGHVYILLEEATGLRILPSSGVFSPEAALTPPAVARFKPLADSVLLPQVFKDAEVWSEVSGDPTTQVAPKLKAGPRGSLYVVTGRGIIRIGDPVNDLDGWRWWLGIEGDALGIDVEGGKVPGGGHVVDLAFDGEMPGVLWRANPDLGLTDDGVLFLFDRSFRASHWQRHYDDPALGLKVNKPLYPRSNVVHAGKTASPLEGEGLSPEILGGFS